MSADALAVTAHSHSLRSRLLWLLLAAVALVGTFQGVGTYRASLQQADAIFDEHLQQMAHAMRGGRPALLALDALEALEGDIDLLVQIWGPDGAELFRSPRSLLPPRAVLGFSDVSVQGKQFRVYTLQTPLQTVQIAQDVSARNARARALAVQATLPAAVLALMLMAVVWWVVRRLMRPIERARLQLASRAAGDLSPLHGEDLPDEIRPLVNELNALFVRLERAFQAQQQFVAHAAHELRSPLTALKLQAQALRFPSDGATPGSVPLAVDRLNQGIDRSIHLVEQLLALARAQAEPAAATPSLVDLFAVVSTAIGDAQSQAHAKGLDLGLSAQSTAQTTTVQGDPTALSLLVRNLIDNALKYTPAPGQVDVGLTSERGHIVLHVEDSGPGIAEADRQRVFERFFRAPAQANQSFSGSGLGLAIVAAVAQAHAATVTLGESPQLGGLRVEVSFAAPQTVASGV